MHSKDLKPLFSPEPEVEESTVYKMCHPTCEGTTKDEVKHSCAMHGSGK